MYFQSLPTTSDLISNFSRISSVYCRGSNVLLIVLVNLYTLLGALQLSASSSFKILPTTLLKSGAVSTSFNNSCLVPPFSIQSEISPDSLSPGSLSHLTLLATLLTFFAIFELNILP
ncbi:MAG: hypothetical protein M1326_09110 [Cyanobacteria bacterium]|nr:hypothetical protein [Cyanobacteriota bacterium]